MPRRFALAPSLLRKAVATVLAVVAFVFLYEVTSDDAVWPWRNEQVVDPSRPQPGAQLQFSATAYCRGNTTASGVEVRTGIAAADPAILPVGSVVTVTTDNQRYNGVYTVMDTGPAVKGRLIDLYLWSCTEARTFGRKQVQVNILRLGWNPNNSTPGLVDRLFRRQGRPRAVQDIVESPPPASVAPETAPVPEAVELPADEPTVPQPDTPPLEAPAGERDTDG